MGRRTASMTDTMIIEAVGFVVAMIAVVAPIVRLNTNIARLNATLEDMTDDITAHDKRITRHGEQIDSLNVTVAEHGARIKVLEEEDRRLSHE
jgi:hypothetical protein